MSETDAPISGTLPADRPTNRLLTTRSGGLASNTGRTPAQWLTAELRGSWLETRTARTLLFSVPGWEGHDAGQHVDIRLTAEDGYTAERSYSVASAPEDGWIQLTVETVSNGEVSPYLVQTMQPGDRMQIRGPIGGWFRWTDDLPEPVLLVGGGSGIVPLMAMVRQRVRSASTTPFHLIYVARTPDHIFYTNELFTIAQSQHDITVDRIYTRSGLPDDPRAPGRLTLADLPSPARAVGDRDEAAATDEPQPSSAGPRVYVCGPTGFVENAAQLLQARGHQPAAIRTERFGPSGG
jgi:ferredoxin-NADP reductase